MKINKTVATILILGAGVFSGFALAQHDRTDSTKLNPQSEAFGTTQVGPIQVAELERLSAQPSLEQSVLKIAAEKLRQENRPMSTVELPVTVRVTKVSLPLCSYQTCWKVGNQWVCKYNICDAKN